MSQSISLRCPLCPPPKYYIVYNIVYSYKEYQAYEEHPLTLVKNDAMSTSSKSAKEMHVTSFSICSICISLKQQDNSIWSYSIQHMIEIAYGHLQNLMGRLNVYSMLEVLVCFICLLPCILQSIWLITLFLYCFLCVCVSCNKQQN